LLQASVSHYTLDRDPSERLMLKYYEYLLRTRDLAKDVLGSRDAHPPGWTTSLLGKADDLVTYAPLVCLAIAMALDFGQLQRSKQAMPAILLNAERVGDAAIGT
jgi:hypothetical protein